MLNLYVLGFFQLRDFMKKRIIFKNLDGSCGIIIAASDAIQHGMTLEEIAMKDVPEGLEWRITDESNLPQDRYFRAAWTDNNPTETVDVDMTKARVIHMDHIRSARNEVFKKLGFPTKLNESLEQAIIPQDIQDKLQILRDLPQSLDLSIATTPEELKAIWPEELNTDNL